MLTVTDFVAIKPVVEFISQHDDVNNTTELLGSLRAVATETPTSPESAPVHRTVKMALEMLLQRGKLSASQISLLQVLRALATYTDGLNYGIGLDGGEIQRVLIGRLVSEMMKLAPTLASLAEVVMDLETAQATTIIIAEEGREEEIRCTIAEETLAKLRSRAFISSPLSSLGVCVKNNAFVVDSDQDEDDSFASAVNSAAEVVLLIMADNHLAISDTGLPSHVSSFLKARKEVVPSDDHLAAALTLVKTIARLARAAEEAQAVVELYNNNYRSLRQIAQTPLNIFVSKMEDTGIAESALQKIHDAAEQIDCWNEHLWLELFHSRRANFAPIVPRAAEGGGDPPRDVSPNNLTDMFLLEDQDSDPAFSVTSLAAYFADLMSLMQETLAKPTDRGSPATLLETLSERRPDLVKLELTGANSGVLIPHISLVNEVLESYIRFREGQKWPRLLVSPESLSLRWEKSDSVAPFTTPSSQESGESRDPDTANDQTDEKSGDPGCYLPDTTDTKVYSHIANQMFPFTTFPYNRARDAIKHCFAAFNIEMYEIFGVFASPELVLQDVATAVRDPREVTKPESLSTWGKLLRGVDESLARQHAAQSLGLLQSDFAAITGETFFPSWLAELVMGLSTAKKPLAVDFKCPWDAATLWGYTQKDAEKAKVSTPTQCMLQTSHELGLSFIKRQMMRRSGVEFQDIIDLTKTRCFGQDLVIANNTGSRDFDGRLEQLRMMSGAAAPPFKPLTESLCFRLQSFLRLQAKLKWSTRQLDSAVACFHNRELETSSTIQGSGLFTEHPQPSVITPFVVQSIASLVQLSELSNIDSPLLLPLWGDIDAFDDKSLLHSKFLTRPIQAMSSVFKSHADKGQYFLDGGQTTAIHTLDEALAAALKWPLEFMDDLLAATCLEEADLTISSLSTLYRHVLLCRILGVAPRQSAAFFHILFATTKEDPFADPMSTVKVVRQWKRIFGAGWTMESVGKVLLSPDQDSDSETVTPGDEQLGLSTITAILEGAKNIRKSMPFLETGNPTSQDVGECAARVFDDQTAASVVRLVEGTANTTFKISLADTKEVNSLLQSSKSWPDKISATPEMRAGHKNQVEVSLTGILTEPERQTLQAQLQKLDLSEDQLKKVTESFDAAIKESLAPWTVIQSRFSNTHDGRERLESCTLGQDWGVGEEGETPETRHERQVQKRRLEFVLLAAPTIIQEMLEALIITTVKDVVPGLDTSLAAVLLSEVVQVPAWEAQGKSAETAMMALQDLSKIASSASTLQPPLDAYFTPSSTDVFTITYKSDSVKSPELSVNGLDLPFDPKTRAFVKLRMTGGQAYHLKSNVAPTDLSWSTPKVLASPFTDEMLLSSSVAARAAQIETAIMRAATISQVYDLTAEEMQYFDSDNASTRLININLNTPSLEGLERLQQYRQLRDATKHRKGATATTISLFSWLCAGSTADASVETISTKISESTGWNALRVKAAIMAKYPNLTDAQRLAALQSFESLVSLQAIMALDERLGRAAGTTSQPSMTTLFNLAAPRKTLAADDSAPARVLQMRLTASQRAAVDENLAGSQRNALVQYLLQQPYVRDELKIKDADGLFEHFLIDVQMGPQLRTSRIKQAISVIQLFAQRCLLGLEKKADKNCIVRDKWQWMQQYSLWEAHRKLFLYPENWLDPTIRDDKSELFETLESTLMQKNLSVATFFDAIKTYVCSLNDISSLEVVAYQYEQKGDNDVYHLFGRSVTAPYGFFYRTLTVIRTSKNMIWRPWTKIDIDIPSVEAGWDGTRLSATGSYVLPVIKDHRMYLFMPQIVPKSVSQGAASMAGDAKPLKDATWSSFQAHTVNSAKAQQVWEITMAWTEHICGKWTPKRMAPGALTASLDAASPTKFRVDPILDKDNMTILVSHEQAKSGQKSAGLAIGRFAFADDQMSKTAGFPPGSMWKDVAESDREKWAPSRPYPTSFQRAVVPADASSEDYSDAALPPISTPGQPHDTYAHRVRQNLLWVPPSIHEHIINKDKLPQSQNPTSLTWTLAPGLIKPGMDTLDGNTNRAGTYKPYTGLALNARHWDGTSSNYFMIPTSDPLTTYWYPGMIRANTDMAVLDHSFSHDLIRAAATPVDPLQNLYQTLAQATSRHGTEIWGTREKTDPHELGQPSALYNWEIALHAPLLAVDRLFSTQQFEEALQIARLVFDPTVDVAVDRLVKRTKSNDGKQLKVTDEHVVSLLSARADVLAAPADLEVTLEKVSTGSSCWRFPPFQDIAARIARDKKEGAVNMRDMDKLLQPAIMERMSHGALVHATARGRPEAYMKWIVMKYVEILVASGDVHFRRSTLESLPLATQRYVEAAHVLGPEPPKVPQLVKRNGRGLTFPELSEEDVRFDLDLPFSPELAPVEGDASGGRGGVNGNGENDKKKERIVCFLKTKYFGVQMNPKFKQLRALVKERLHNIRNGLDIEGRPVSYSLMEPLIDPGALVALDKAGFGMSDTLSMVIGDRDSPLPRQRFEILLHRALELCGELKSLGERLLSAAEKREAEAFSILRARHATQLHRMMLDIKETSLTEAKQTFESLQISRGTQASQLAYYLALIGEPETRIPSPRDAWVDIAQDIDKPTQDELRMSNYEKEEMSKSESAFAMNLVAQGLDALVSAFFLVPSVSVNMQPMGVGTTVAAGGGSTLAKVTQAGSTALRFAAGIQSELGSRAARKAQLARQLQERRLQANIHGREIKAIDKQIEIQQTRIRAAQKDIEQQQAQLDESTQIEAWYRTKYTNEQLYAWIEKSLRSLYYQAYTLAMSVARRAESALAFELGRQAQQPQPILRPGGYWDASRDGLLAADQLYLDLKRIETVRLESNTHDYEISKTVSLRQIDPLALMRLRITGSATFSLQEALFDMDFPGHYMRRLRSVAVSIPAVVGPYGGVNATLTLLKHKYRVSNLSTSSAADYASGSSESFRTDRVPISSVAISSGAHDAGVFELNFAGPRYVPFEGAGAISTWQLDLPTEVKRFDYQSISDVLLHVQYTAVEGGACLRDVANGAVRAAVRGVSESEAARTRGLWAMFDLKNDFVNEWYAFSRGVVESKPAEEVVMTLDSIKERLPFWARQEEGVEIKGISLVGRDATFVDGLTVSAGSEGKIPGQASSEQITEWRVRAWTDLNVKDLEKWTITSPKEDSQGTKVENVYLLVCYVLGQRTKKA